MMFVRWARRWIRRQPTVPAPGCVARPAVQVAEQEAARRRILDQAEAERTPLDDTTRVVPGRRRRREQR
ncbi:hypothetical protein [Micromonospora endophytica]|uniref:Uncharacterized protein n=1 Tax=Micromonospora endophytica TaxID=515350 RepID=A0A2W2BIH6_9ACTN|nr:hypothetical protein [Micromonospora endophytica]PZF85060.1 hypothetical protein C1I93_28915 [Micromonospora endophytica]BCJ62017.1 hypothetical protein Jiend_54390 [Micromonospora endophytica]